MTDHYLGLLSGTSMDGIDCALVRISEDGDFSFLAARGSPYPAPVHEGLAALHAGPDSLERLGSLDVAIGELFATAALQLLEETGVDAAAVRAIGSHGQTVLHRPRGQHPFSLQIGQPAIIAQRTGITTVADFRPRDMAAGGEGAPLAPAFHAAVLRHHRLSRAVINLGGIANLTQLPADPGQPVTGFDCGPANTLLDHWYRLHRAGHFDSSGAWATTGTVDGALLERLLADEYFSILAPKSTGPEYFNLQWLDRALAQDGRRLEPRDIQATLLELTARSVAQSVQQQAAVDEVLVCGGGIHNRALMNRLAEILKPLPVYSSAHGGVDPDWVEACTFAWLAWRTVHGLTGNLPSVTGAIQAVPLGAIWPAAKRTRIDPETFTDGG